MKKRTLALILAVLCLNPLYGCSNTAENDETESQTSAAVETETEETEEDDSRPKPASEGMNFDGASFRVLYRYGASTYNCYDITSPDGMNGEIVNDTVYHRNLALEENLGITLEAIPDGDPLSFLRADVQSGGGEFDVVIDMIAQLAPVSLNNYLYDWRDMPYFDETVPWWDSNSISELSIANHVYMVSSDISMKTSGCVRFFCFNKTMLENYGLEEPYEYVENGTWTIDKMSEYAHSVALDLNGDGVMDGNDRYGLLNESPSFMLVGCGVLYTVKDENDIPTVGFMNEHTVTALEKVKALLDDSEHVLDYYAFTVMDTSSFKHVFDYGRSRFAAGQFLMIDISADDIYQFADMDDRYGILPNPKLDESQSEYYHLIDPYAPIWGLSVIQKNPELTSAAMEMWGYLSGDLVDAFYETTMKGKRADAPEDAAMLDVVRGSVRYELATVMQFGITDVIDTAYSSGNLSSSYEKRAKMINKVMKSMFKDFIEE